MIASIIASGLAIGAVYALIGITYNTMYSASRVMSFTAGQFGMLGGVFGALFMTSTGLPAAASFVLTVAACALAGVVTEIVAVRRVLHKLEQHLYVLSTLALAQMMAQLTAIGYGTEPKPFPRIFGIGRGDPLDEKFWLPLLACGAIIIALELLYRHSLLGFAFRAIAEDQFASRALGLPEAGLRVASFAIAGAIGGAAGFAGGQLLLAFFGNGGLLTFYGFIPVAIGGVGNNRGALAGGLALGLFQQAANFVFGGVFASVAVFTAFIVILLLAPNGIFGAVRTRRV
ncbi:branched-chain amino acid ABC transporter permease [Enterovirga sp. CN4-39]|uniref:branched-chain amino acid ABC transporter permease n=1 Tax=Enterovirga sp. CN4-39 TaxID=3400910 RepID=UPI003C061DBE